ncbi:hypothetical protein AT246_06875 [Bartonella henselae]|uniref:Uncharacterized protein n=1 Tax=Bartonella henselae TaxID=38323 RepID=X5M8P0_BARHN|nr:hypothetical protein Q653_01532 [Bartonella henselae JK 42]ETS11104.1 hypothetical protein Q652_01505 [Bartonella henselae JK 41]KEC56217.1 hypothetical protein O97_01424 [Bartonella henselae str. Zeus]KEC58915.1 hypothetical protein O95_01481 [Bartonella henselae JK 53]OLL47127.1 hypothetical protein AT247_03645 [Bartonella henselae]
MTQQEKHGEKRPLSSVVFHGLTNASTLYEALSSSPNNAYQPYLCLKIPLKKLKLEILKEYARGNIS